MIGKIATRILSRGFAPYTARTAVLLFVVGIVFPRCSWASPQRQWVETWGAAQLRADAADSPSTAALTGATLRQVAHISIGGNTLRLHLSNAFGDSPLIIKSVQLGRRRGCDAGSVEPGSQTAVRFNGHMDVSIPAGAEYFSDAIQVDAPALSDVVVTMYIGMTPAMLTSHPGSRATSFLVRGDHVTDAELESAQTFAHWYFIAGIEVEKTAKANAVVAFGDSITDGHGATTDGNDRWPDVLARRLADEEVGVVNEGIGGNRILLDGLGPNGLARFDRDVVSVPGVRFLIVLEGINDLGALDRLEEHSQEVHDALVERLEDAFGQIAERARTHGIRVYGGTLTPYRGSDYYHPSERSEADRQKINQWIRGSKVFDGVIDFDALVRDPAHPDRMAREFDSGDHLHPGPAGYRRMGEALPLELFKH